MKRYLAAVVDLAVGCTLALGITAIAALVLIKERYWGDAWPSYASWSL